MVRIIAIVQLLLATIVDWAYAKPIAIMVTIVALHFAYL
jgi:hypothetical protein